MLSPIGVAYYSLRDKEYHAKSYEGEFEVLNTTENVSLVDGKPFIHMHITLCHTEFNSFGGHVIEGTVGPTLEMFLEAFEETIMRKLDSEIGLKLMDI